MNFETAYRVVLLEEGGTANVAGDRGGLTSRGISTPLCMDCCRRFGWPLVTPDKLTEAQCQQIYRTQFWDACRCDLFPDAWALMIFDMAVNSGVRPALLTVQAVLKMKGLYNGKVDGDFGPLTLAAARGSSPLIFLDARAGFYVAEMVNHPTEQKFIEGWLNRLKNQLSKITELTIPARP